MEEKNKKELIELVKSLQKEKQDLEKAYIELDLECRDLRTENEELKSPKFASWKLKFFNLKEEFDKELAEHEEFTKKANAEIERLTKWKDKLQDTKDELERQLIDTGFKEYCEENAELQKQVEVLTAEKENLYFLNKNLEDYIDNHEPIWKRNTEQAVKDTAKEIAERLKERFAYDIERCKAVDEICKEITDKGEQNGN